MTPDEYARCDGLGLAEPLQLALTGFGGTSAVPGVVIDIAPSPAAAQSANEFQRSYLNPFPANLGEIIKGFKKVLIPELNRGQLRMLIRAEFLVDAVGLNKVQGKPFAVREVVAKIEELIK